MGDFLSDGGDRRDFIKRMAILGGGAFMAPTIASFALQSGAQAVGVGPNTGSNTSWGSNMDWGSNVGPDCGSNTICFNAYHVHGFNEPVRNPNIINTVKARQVVPFRFTVLRNDTDLPESIPGLQAALFSQLVSCGGTTASLPGFTGIFREGLTDLGGGKYLYLWKVPDAFKGQDRVVRLNLTGDNLFCSLEAWFRIR